MDFYGAGTHWNLALLFEEPAEEASDTIANEEVSILGDRGVHCPAIYDGIITAIKLCLLGETQSKRQVTLLVTLQLLL